jgi:hypothetical protein
MGGISHFGKIGVQVFCEFRVFTIERITFVYKETPTSFSPPLVDFLNFACHSPSTRVAAPLRHHVLKLDEGFHHLAEYGLKVRIREGRGDRVGWAVGPGGGGTHIHLLAECLR